MSKRISPISLIVLTVLIFALLWSGVQKAVSQQDEERKQALAIGYPNPSIIISGTNTRYGGIIYVEVYPITPSLVRKHGAGPLVTAELNPSQRGVWQLPLGEYEVHYQMRTGSELKTFIVRQVILRPEGAGVLTVEMNADAKTTIIGDDMSVREMEELIRQSAKEIADLKEEVARLKQK
jgi:hypothetical protein